MSQYQLKTIVNRLKMLYDDLTHEIWPGLVPEPTNDNVSKAMWHLTMSLLIFRDELEKTKGE